MKIIGVFHLGLIAAMGVPAAVIPATDPVVRAGLSPYNWVRGGDFIGSTVSGASMTLGFTDTRNLALLVDTSHLAGREPARCPIIAWTVNGGAAKSHQIAPGQSSIILAANVDNPVIALHIKGMSPFEDRWSGDTPANSVKITGFEADDGASAMTVPMPEKIWLNIGDSIMSGDSAGYAAGQGRPADSRWAEASDSRASYGYLLASHFGFGESRIAYGGYNWSGGMAGIPTLPRLIDQMTSTASRLSEGALSPSPEVVLVNLGENGVPGDDQVIGGISHLRSRVGPHSRILVMIPVSGKGRAEISRAFAQYRSRSGDPAAWLIDPGPVRFATADGQHPTSAGHRSIFKAVREACAAVITNRGEP